MKLLEKIKQHIANIFTFLKYNNDKVIKRMEEVLDEKVNDFQNEYESQYNISKEQLFLKNLAKEYHDRCEEYDRKVCTGPVVGKTICPRNDYEFRLINRFATEVKKELFRKAEQKGITPEQVNKAIAAYQLDYKRWE